MLKKNLLDIQYMLYSVYMKFLIVEDSRPARNLIKSYVSEMTFETPVKFFEAEDGEAALTILQKNPIHFIFMDWYLATEMTGLDVLKEIRKDDKFKKVPVFMISSGSDKSNVIESLKYGANGYIVKPIDKKAFVEKVLKLLASTR